jgi:two-component system, NtrC family, nitrogen regulation sensor histidine kinase NtrY
VKKGLFSSRAAQWIAGLVVALLLASVFTLGSLKVPVSPENLTDVVALWVVSFLLVIALLVALLVLGRTFVRIFARQFGVRFTTKMVIGAMTISLLPIVFMFLMSYALLNRTLNRWFTNPLLAMSQDDLKMVSDQGRRERDRLNEYAKLAADELSKARSDLITKPMLEQFRPGIDALIIFDNQGRAISVAGSSALPLTQEDAGALYRTLPSGAEVWRSGNDYAMVGRATMGDDSVVALRQTTADIVDRPAKVQEQIAAFNQQSELDRTFKYQMLLALSLFTVALLLAVTWFALFLSKQVTVPIQALAEGTRAVSTGNFDYRVEVDTKDELGVLVNSFNDMTSQLADSRKQIDTFTRNLQTAVQEIESRRKLLETVLQNIPTGVISLDAQGDVIQLNNAALRIFGEGARSAKDLTDVVGSEAAPDFQSLLRRSLRLGTAAKALDLIVAGRMMHSAVTVSALGAAGTNSGFVVVVDDLSELLRAQKLAAWQEVAQRIAHEIKNPLTPIQLSADRLARFISRRAAGAAESGRDLSLEQIVSDCASSIGREVTTLKSLVDEFSRFVRFPQAKLAPADANAIVAEAVDVFRGRLDGITLRTGFAANLPAIKADGELLRGVIVNLIDNAAEALEGSPAKEIAISTRQAGHGDAVEIIVADTGCGISPEDKDKLFLPHFSTKNRGTGLGLAIASRVAGEHHGTLRVEDNSPVGSRFILRLPTVEVAAPPVASEA